MVLAVMSSSSFFRDRPGSISESAYRLSTNCSQCSITKCLADTVSRIFALALAMVPNQLRSCDTANDTFGNVSFVMRTGIPAPSIFLLANEDNVVIAIGVSIAVAVAAVLALVVQGFFAMAVPLYLFYSALVVVIFLAARWLATSNGPLFRDLGSLLNDLVGGLLSTHNDLLAHRFL
jgi:hypothetical protein